MPLAVAFLALAPAGAWGVADVIKSTNNNRFDKATYSSDEGDLVRFEHTGGGPHNVTSTQLSGGERLFSSATITTGSTPVNRTQSLASGTYPFFCTVHSNQMRAELVVRASGSPPPEDGTPPPEDGTPPPEDGTPPPEDGGPGPGPLTLDLRAKKQELTKKLKFFATASVASTLVTKGKKIKETTEQLAANQETKVTAKLKRKARNRLEEKLEQKGKAKVNVEGTATNQSGATATDTVKVKLKD